MTTLPPTTRTLTQADSTARWWFALAVGALVTAGLLALLLVVGRLPGIGAIVSLDPGFFRRVLVLHVDLALVVWFAAFISTLLSLLRPGRAARMARFAPGVAVAGLALLVVATAAPSATPILSNYVPMLDHPAWAAGLVVFGVGVLLAAVDTRVGAGPFFPPAAAWGLRAAALSLVLAGATFAVSALTTPAGLDPASRYELLVWGGGHVLQLASTCAMISVWIVLASASAGRPVVASRVAAVLFALLVLPWLVSPLLVLGGTHTTLARAGFTALMRWGIFPVVLVFLALCLRGARLRDPRALGLLASGGLTLLGFALGAAIRGSDTMVPAHYHANIGAVTAAFMAVTPLLLAPLGLALPVGLHRLVRWQPVIFGLGQAVFAVGFGFAGSPRKSYADEHTVRSVSEVVGLYVMGAGGLVALAGGVLFLVLALSALPNPRSRWNPIPSRS